MVKIRLQKYGRATEPIYRVVVADYRIKRDGKVIAHVGHYDPIRKRRNLNKIAILKWRNFGAVATHTVFKIFPT